MRLQRLLVKHLDIEKTPLDKLFGRARQTSALRTEDRQGGGHSSLVVYLDEEGAPSLLHQFRGRLSLLRFDAALRVDLDSHETMPVEDGLYPRDGLRGILGRLQQLLKLGDFRGR